MAQVLFNILMEPELLAQVDKVAGPRKRSEWIRQACVMRLAADVLPVKEEYQPEAAAEPE